MVVFEIKRNFFFGSLCPLVRIIGKCSIFLEIMVGKRKVAQRANLAKEKGFPWFARVSGFSGKRDETGLGLA